MTRACCQKRGWWPRRMHALAMVMTWSLMTVQHILRMHQEMPELPGANENEASISSSVSSLAVNGSKLRPSVCRGSSCWTVRVTNLNEAGYYVTGD